MVMILDCLSGGSGSIPGRSAINIKIKLMIRVKINDKSNKELSFLIFKKAAAFTLKKYKKNKYFQKKKK